MERLRGRAARTFEKARTAVTGEPQANEGEPQQQGSVVSQGKGHTLLLVTPAGVGAHVAADLVQRELEKQGLLYVEDDAQPDDRYFEIFDTSYSTSISIHRQGESNCTLDVDTKADSAATNGDLLSMLLETLDSGGAMLSAVTEQDRLVIRRAQEPVNGRKRHASKLARVLLPGEVLLGSVHCSWEPTSESQEVHILAVSEHHIYRSFLRLKPAPVEALVMGLTLEAIALVQVDRSGERIRLTMSWLTGEPDLVAEVDYGGLEDFLSGLRGGGVNVVDQRAGMAGGQSQ